MKVTANPTQNDQNNQEIHNSCNRLTSRVGQPRGWLIQGLCDGRLGPRSLYLLCLVLLVVTMWLERHVKTQRTVKVRIKVGHSWN